MQKNQQGLKIKALVAKKSLVSSMTFNDPNT